MKTLNLVGKKFSRLVVISRSPNRGKKVIWLCHCDCGQSSLAQTSDLTSGKHRSCGCLHIDSITKHGKINLPEYHSWQCMKDRCNNPKATHYGRYGGRGITVCSQWQTSFESFLKDMGSRPSPKHTLERINNNGNYTPSNCRWATRKEQAQNRCKRT